MGWIERMGDALEEVSPLPWSHHVWDGSQHAVADANGRTIAIASAVYPECMIGLDEDNAEFIAWASIDLPSAVKLVRALNEAMFRLAALVAVSGDEHDRDALAKLAQARQVLEVES